MVKRQKIQVTNTATAELPTWLSPARTTSIIDLNRFHILRRNILNCISHCNKFLPFPTNKNQQAGNYTNRTFAGCRDKHRQKNPRKQRAPKQIVRLCRSHHGEWASFCLRRFQCMPCTGRANGDYSVVGLGSTR